MASRERVLTALILAPLALAAVLWLPQSFTLTFFGVLVLLGGWEWSGFLTHSARIARVAYVVSIAALMALTWFLTQDLARFHALLWVSAAWWAVAFTWLACFPSRVTRVAAAIAGLLVLVPAGVALGRLHAIDHRGPLLTICLLLLIWAADVGAYFAGRAWGRTKLAPRVSPGKTWEGVLGGVAAAICVAVVSGRLLELPQVPFVALCIAVTLISVVGDLTESLFKRYAGMKDSGALFPGHGGVLDRIDSITAAAPFFVLGLNWLGIAP